MNYNDNFSQYKLNSITTIVVQRVDKIDPIQFYIFQFENIYEFELIIQELKYAHVLYVNETYIDLLW